MSVGEESAQQIKLRAERLGDIDSEFYLYAETNMQSVRAEVERIQPDFLIIDSIQTIMSPEISGVQGSVSQVREVTAELMQLAKTNNIAIFIVGHVTKEGTFFFWQVLGCWSIWWIRCSTLKANATTPSES